MRRVDPTREWPGEKANSELADWFDKYFEKNQIEFPSIEQTTQFYRSGVTGVEYLGMIRKMAAINRDMSIWFWCEQQSTQPAIPIAIASGEVRHGRSPQSAVNLSVNI